MTKYAVKKSAFSAEGFFAAPAFNLFRADSDVLNVVTSCLAAFFHIRGADIRIDQETNPVGNAGIIFDLRPFNGVARISTDNARIALFSPHLLDTGIISDLSSSFFCAVDEVLPPDSYGHYLVQFSFHAALENVSPTDHTRRFISTPSESSQPIIGNSVTYYFGKHDLRLHSSITLDMSGEFPGCVFIRTAMGFDANRIFPAGLRDAVVDHSNSLLSLVDLEAD